MASSHSYSQQALQPNSSRARWIRQMIPENVAPSPKHFVAIGLEWWKSCTVVSWVRVIESTDEMWEKMWNKATPNTHRIRKFSLTRSFILLEVFSGWNVSHTGSFLMLEVFSWQNFSSTRTPFSCQNFCAHAKKKKGNRATLPEIFLLLKVPRNWPIQHYALAIIFSSKSL